MNNSFEREIFIMIQICVYILCFSFEKGEYETLNFTEKYFGPFLSIFFHGTVDHAHYGSCFNIFKQVPV